MALRCIRLPFRHHVTLVDLSVHVSIRTARSLFTLNRSPTSVRPSHPRTPLSASLSPPSSLPRVFSLSFSLSRSLRHLPTILCSLFQHTFAWRGRFYVENFAKGKNESAHRRRVSKGRKRRACLWTITLPFLSRSVSLLARPWQKWPPVLNPIWRRILVYFLSL